MDWKNKNVLVTGGSGWIGSALVRRLKILGANVTSLSRSGRGSEALQADLTSPEDLKRALAGKKFDVVYHLATAGVNPTRDQNVDLMQSNVAGVKNLLSVLKEAEPCPIVVAGSWTEYGISPSGIMSESQICHPTSPYGKSKLAATELACEWARQNNRPLTVLRLFSVYGEGEATNRLGFSACAALSAGRPPELSNPDFKRDFIHISDVVEAFLQAAELAEPGLIVNVGTGRAISLAEFVAIIQKIMGTNIQPIIGQQGARPWDVPVIQADLTINHKVLNWTPKISLEDGVKRAVQDFIQRLKI